MNPLIIVYSLAAFLSICLFVLVSLFVVIIFLVAKKNPTESYEYLRNIVYATFGGIIAIILLELKGEDISNPYFWTFKIPITLLVIFIFILLGFLYLYLLKKMFFWINFRLHKNGKQKI